ncbi:transmembrane anchor protein [Vibrio sp. SCSIO 43137]|uniref:transmembrane anchor protein n=1 Tax=Vibrio sp. SCSIO 43137 TaxID=3021011 RepID=UPI002307FC59|nr:transmembrane anchor protein [Vibrio sp. SCSIO 43137]WCE31517.1 transmembrane anchor protein [Vibrio sp. SCSIO 43137]
MYNTDMPTRAELPTTRQLLRSTIIALVPAITILVTVVLPSEYAIDPTGAGRLLGLTEMGEIKAQLAKEAAQDKAINTAQQAPVVEEQAPVQVATAADKVQTGIPVPEWRDKIVLTLKPGQGAEVKLVMDKGETATFQWRSKGGPVNFDTHGDGNGNSISYEKGRGVPDDAGELVANFTGNHGWFFRNRNKNTVMVILETAGEYKELKRVL